MIAPATPWMDELWDAEVDNPRSRSGQTPRVALRQKRQLTGRQRQAQRARFGHGRSSAVCTGGVHRRGGKPGRRQALAQMAG